MKTSGWFKNWTGVVICVVTLGLTSCGAPVGPGIETITVGALVPLTGGQSSLGEAVDASLKLAVDIINNELGAADTPWRIELRVEDSQSNPEEAFEKLRTLSEAGVRVVVGPFDTDSVKLTAPLADRLSTVLLACASVLPDTEQDNDRLARMMPSLETEVDAVADALEAGGIDHVAFVGRDTDWAVAFVDLLAATLIDRGGTVPGAVLYDPFANNVNDFGAELTELEGLVTGAIDSFGNGAVGVVLLSQDEGVQLFAQADANPALAQVPWYGSSSFSRVPELLASEDARSFAAATAYTAPLFYEVDSNGFRAVQQGIRDDIGRDGSSTAVVAYDALWIAALTINQVQNRSDPILLRNALPSVLNGYNGVSGRFQPDANGDRSGGGYDLWTVQLEGTGAEWVRTVTFVPSNE